MGLARLFLFILQLLLVTQGTLFGQIMLMFIISLSASRIDNHCLSSFDMDKIQAKLKTLGSPTNAFDLCLDGDDDGDLGSPLLFDDVTDSLAQEGQDLSSRNPARHVSHQSMLLARFVRNGWTT